MFYIEQSELKEKLMMIAGISTKRFTMPILGYCMIEIDENYMCLSVTDLEVSGRVLIGCRSDSLDLGTQQIVDCKHFLTIVKSLGDGTLSCQYDLAEKFLMVTDSNGVSVKIGLGDVDDYPNAFPKSDKYKYKLLKLTGKELSDVFSRVLYSASLDQTRYHLNGVCLDYSESCLVSTDGHRLARVKLPSVLCTDETLCPILPSSALKHVIKAFKKSKADVTLCITEPYARIASPSIEFQFKLIEGKYPNYKQLIPKSGFKFSFAIEPKTLLEVLKRLKPLTHKKNAAIRMKCLDGSISVAVWDFDKGSESMEIVLSDIDVKGNGLNYGFNSVYLMDFLKACNPNHRIEFTFGDTLSPLLLLQFSTNDTGVIMPMRLKEIEKEKENEESQSC